MFQYLFFKLNQKTKSCLRNKNKIKKIISQFKKKKIRTSLFVNPNIKDIYLSKEIGADCIEIHTGHFSNLVKSKKILLRNF